MPLKDNSNNNGSVTLVSSMSKIILLIEFVARQVRRF